MVDMKIKIEGIRLPRHDRINHRTFKRIRLYKPSMLDEQRAAEFVNNYNIIILRCVCVYIVVIVGSGINSSMVLVIVR